jgi:glyoxylase-like metal-dependent hydrolase (beta-lactamase superfamily II)
MIAAVLAVLTGTAEAQQGSIEVTRLTDRLYLLSTDQGSYTTNTLASVGDDGVLLVDTQAKSAAAGLKEVVDAFGKGTPKYIINTHRHVEHVGGNAIFGEDPVIIAHALVPAKLRQGSYLFDEFPAATFPDVTLADSLRLFFNGERIRIIALPGGHDDNEIVVHFTESKVVHLSSIVNGFNFPSIDADGDVLRFAVLVQQAIELLPDDVVIVSGHNDTGTWHDLHSYRDMLLRTAETVRSGLAEGKDLAALQEEGVLDDWQSYAGSYVSVNAWIEYLVDGLQPRADARTTMFEPLYYVWRDRGATAAIEHYVDLKRNHSSEFRSDDRTLFVIGAKLFGNDHLQDAIEFLEADLIEYPESDHAYYANYQLAQAYGRLGDRETGVRYAERALELSPGFHQAAELLERLRRP